MAVLEAVLSPEWEHRCHSFDDRWSEKESMASMRNGAGDEYSIVFSAAGAYVRGFDHESPMSPYAQDGPWPGVLDEVPDVFRRCVEEPAFSDEDGCGFSESVQPPTLRQQGGDWVLRIPAASPLLDGRHLGIGTTVDGLLSVWYAGVEPGTYCGVASFGEPPA